MTERFHCPADPDATAAAYLAGCMAPEEAAAFEEHYLACPPCGEHFQFTEHFIAAYRRVAERLADSTRKAAEAGA
jgi:hypothetical protein